jgi:hypothetical protein
MSSDAGIGTFWQRLVLVNSRAAGTSKSWWGTLLGIQDEEKSYWLQQTA